MANSPSQAQSFLSDDELWTFPDPPPTGSWGPDFLGPGFEAQTLPLLINDAEDDPVATLVRYLPHNDPKALAGTPSTPTFTLLYLHGWNDYFFQTHLARQIARLGGAFYALDLRRYGRSLRKGQMRGWCDDLTIYDEDISAAFAVLREERPWDSSLIMMGHSTGGLIASIWADRHPGALDALILNSPWLELQGSSLLRMLGEPVVNTLARRDPTMPIMPRRQDVDAFFDIHLGWNEDRDGPMTHDDWKDDPYVTGWNVYWPFKQRPTPPIRPGWMQAIMAGHARVAQGLSITCPVFVMLSAHSHFGFGWNDQARHTDTVIDAPATAKRAVQLGNLVTIARFEGALHDVTLSEPPVREQAMSAMRRWVSSYVLGQKE